MQEKIFLLLWNVIQIVILIGLIILIIKLRRHNKELKQMVTYYSKTLAKAHETIEEAELKTEAILKEFDYIQTKIDKYENSNYHLSELAKTQTEVLNQKHGITK